ncbi:MAG: AAA family ATPase [Acidobacteriota bacterium]
MSAGAGAGHNGGGVSCIDAADLLAGPAQPIRWLVHELIPKGTVGDVSGPPGDGKSSILLDLALALAGDALEWAERRLAPEVDVAILGGERSSSVCLQRDLHRTGRPAPPRGRLVFPGPTEIDECPPLWKWNREAAEWLQTEWGKRVTEWLSIRRVGLVILDTLLATSRGCDPLNIPQQYELGNYVRRWAREIGSDTTVLTVSHTNQASMREPLDWRLHYLSRAGSSGLPGALRWLAGVSRLRDDDDIAVQNMLDVERRKLIAFGISKNNEMPQPDYTNNAPAIFEIRVDGGVQFVRHATRAMQPTKPAKGGRSRARD